MNSKKSILPLILIIILVSLIGLGIFYILRNKPEESTPQPSWLEITETSEEKTEFVLKGTVAQSLFTEDGFYKLEVIPQTEEGRTIKVFLVPSFINEIPLGWKNTTEITKASAAVTIEKAKEALEVGKGVEIRCQVFKPNFIKENCVGDNCSSIISLNDRFMEDWDSYLKNDLIFVEIGFGANVYVYED